MNFDRLQTFTIAAEELNFTQAARRLNLSQPAISQQIRELEDSLEVTLFERRGRSLVLTPAGERLRPLALSILKHIREAGEELMEFRGLPQGVLHIGASTTLGIYLLPAALGRFSKLFPGVRPSLRVADTEGVLRAMHEGELDIAMVEEELSPGRTHGWERLPLLQDELVLIADPAHPWAGKGPIPRDSLTETPLIMRQLNSPTRQLIIDRLAEAGFRPDRLNVRFELSHTEGIKRAVMAGLGTGFVSRFAIAEELRSGTLVELPIEDFTISRTLWLLRHAEKKKTIHLQRFIEMLLKPDWLPKELVVKG